MDACVRACNFAPINDWLRERIWKHGCLYRPGELFERAVGAAFDPTVFTAIWRKNSPTCTDCRPTADLRDFSQKCIDKMPCFLIY